MKHARFEKLVADAKRNIQEISPQETAAALDRGDTLLIDVRDPGEWQEGHIPGTKNFSRGTVELEIEEAAPDLSTPTDGLIMAESAVPHELCDRPSNNEPA